MKVFPGGEIRCPTADVGHALRLVQVCLLTPELLHQQLMLCDVHCGNLKPLENSVFDNRNTDTANVPHLSAWSNNPLRYIAASSLLTHRCDGFSHEGAVQWVDRGQILLKGRDPILRVQAKDFVYLVRPIVDSQIVERPAPHMGEALSLTKMKLSSLQGSLCALPVSDVLNGTEHSIGPTRGTPVHLAQALDRTDVPVRSKDSVFTVSAHSRTYGLLGRAEHKISSVRMNHFAYRS
jgi:hypothetical protein